MHIPVELLDALQQVTGFDEKSFMEVHDRGEQITSIRYNPLKQTAHGQRPTSDFRVPWSTHGYYLPERPSFTFDPSFHAGLYYVQEASSMFLEQALQQTVDLSQPLRILDLCAAPGGKSTLIQSVISENSLLVSNEVIKSRASVLEENLTKWGGANTIVTNNDPSIFGRLENYFDVIIIDAPCSGSGLFRRDPKAVNEWSEGNVQLCSQRQQRILADVYPALKQGGILIYSTCSYSEEEDECIADWMIEKFNVESLRLKVDEEWNIVETESEMHNSFGYRFFPDKLKGEGLFITCFRKRDGGQYDFRQPKKMKLEKISRKEEAVINPWINKNASIQLWRLGDLIFAFPVQLEKELLTLVSSDLYIRKAGVAIGSMARQELIPDHALAVSALVSPDLFTISLKKEEALQYLRKEEVKTLSPHRGWALVQYEGMNLGWIKILANRSNNYYPKEWRILKSGNQ